MIDNYLKTGMVFYDSMDKQHFRSACCKEDFCQFTDVDHFPSFQFEFDTPLTGFGHTFEIYDLNDNLIVNWGAAPNAPDLKYYYLGEILRVIYNRHEDEVVYPVEIDYETCYYVRVSFAQECLGGYVRFYSEAFRICDCETTLVGDGNNLIENGWLNLWTGAADPNNVPIGWTVNNNDATNYVHDAVGCRCQLISTAPLANIYIRQAILEIGKWYVATINITTVVAAGIELTDGITTFAIWTTIGIKNIVFQAGGVGISLRRRTGVATNVTFTDFRVEEFVGFAFCDRMTLNWWSDCDWDDIIYQYGYRNSLVLADPDKINLQIPSEEITLNTNERLGEKLPSDIIIKKIYRFKIRIPEYLWNALIRLPAYGSEMPIFHCWITLPDGSACPMSEVAILGEWDKGNCMNTFEVQFVDNHEYPLVATNCCDTILCECEENLLTDGIFANWTGVPPDDTLDDWVLVGVDDHPNQWITEDADGALLHGRASPNGIGIAQTILTIGKWYCVEFDLVSVTNGECNVMGFMFDTAGHIQFAFLANDTIFGIAAEDAEFVIGNFVVCEI